VIHLNKNRNLLPPRKNSSISYNSYVLSSDVIIYNVNSWNGEGDEPTRGGIKYYFWGSCKRRDTYKGYDSGVFTTDTGKSGVFVGQRSYF
jgi:hypothetical protein